MPEKPKRRKNNKNKRKNKNNKADLNKNQISDVSEPCLDATTSDQSELVENTQDIPNLGNTSENPDICCNNSTSEEQSVIVQSCSDSSDAQHLTQQDLNNNREIADFTHDSVTVMNQDCDPQSISDNYIVESPEQSLKTKTKLNSKVKSKSLDNDDEPKIEEILGETSNDDGDDTTMAIIDINVLVSDVESDVEWEKIEEEPNKISKELATGTLSITSIPLNIAQCEHTKSLTPDEEMSLRHYLQTLNLATNPNVNTIEIKTEIEQIINQEIRHRLRKKGLADDFIAPRLGPPRFLDVIDEESSESSLTSRRQSYLSDKKSDTEELEDEVFVEPKTKPPIAVKPSIIKNFNTRSNLIPQKCVLVGAKLKNVDVAEARGDWSVQAVEQMKGAEVVYLTDSSSSTSSIYELDDDKDDDDELDRSVHIITPTIEVTDADSLLKNSFLSETKDDFQTVNNQLEKLTEDLNKMTDTQTNESNVENNESDNPHEIIISSIDDIKTNLYVKDIENNAHPQNSDVQISEISPSSVPKLTNDYDLEMKEIKCELNNAINNLIKEVASDSEINESQCAKDTFVRQDSSSSIGSSQCTAKYNPTYSSLNDVSNILHDETCDKIGSSKSEEYNVSHVKDVFECVTGSTDKTKRGTNHQSKPLSLRDICVQRIANLPYGDKILEELASVSKRLQSINTHTLKTDRSLTVDENVKVENMPYYPLPDVSSIEKVSLPIKLKEPQPPPIKPRHSSLKKSQEDSHWTAMPTKTEPVYVCLSPSQKMLMEKTNTIITKEDASQLVDMHKKYVDRRGYNESYNETRRDEKEKHVPPIVPFKSQTGSRLLALIRDPSLTNINATNGEQYYNEKQKSVYYSDSETSYKQRTEERGKVKDFTNNFKPIPPPRPKKYSSTFYESDESSDFTDTSLRSIKSERKFFHYSTGNLSKDIENDISSIQNMHRYCNNIRDINNDPTKPRRPSLPKDICDQQMEYIRKKEKEVEAEIKRLEHEKLTVFTASKQGPKAPLISEKEFITENVTNDTTFSARKKYDNPVSTETDQRNNSKLSSLFSSSQEELLRDKMYSEYVNQMAERHERKQHKIIKITNPSATVNTKTVSRSMPAIDNLDSKVNNRIEKEFICKARERWHKLGIADPETEDERDNDKDVYREPKVIEHKIKVIEGGEERDVKKLPTHLQEFVSFTVKQKEQASGSSGESEEPASPHVVICAVIIVVLAAVRYVIRMLRNL